MAAGLTNEALKQMGEAKRMAAATEHEMSVLIGAKSCRSCEWRVKLTGVKDKLFCRRFPPQVYGGPVPSSSGQPHLLWTATYPEVNADLPCGEYKRNEAHALEEIATAAGSVGVKQ